MDRRICKSLLHSDEYWGRLLKVKSDITQNPNLKQNKVFSKIFVKEHAPHLTYKVIQKYVQF